MSFEKSTLGDRCAGKEQGRTDNLRLTPRRLVKNSFPEGEQTADGIIIRVCCSRARCEQSEAGQDIRHDCAVAHAYFGNPATYSSRQIMWQVVSAGDFWATFRGSFANPKKNQP